MSTIKSFARGFIIAMPGAILTAPMGKDILAGDHKSACVAAICSIAANVAMIKIAGNDPMSFKAWNKAEALGFRIGSWGIAAACSAIALHKELAKR